MTPPFENRFAAPEEPKALWDEWSEHVGPFFDLSRRDETDLSKAPAMHSYHLGALLTGDVKAPAQNLDRSASKIADQGVDHILIQFYATGRSRARTERGVSITRPGQALVYDLSQPVTVASDQAVDAVNIVLPRALLLPRAADLSDLHGTSFDYHRDAASRIFFGFVRELVGSLRELPPGDMSEIAQVAATLCSASLPSSQDRPTPKAARDIRTGLDIRDFIRRNFAVPDLDADAIAARFGLSRSALYRQFASEGGVHAHIRERRLRHAMRLMTMPGARPRVSSVAYQCGFADEKSFSRAFKTRFGLLPSEAAAGFARPEAPGMGGSLAAWILSLED
ncbi:AraC family transcriptional regulator [Aureimonas phyllosphaerae]|uniref:AraC-like DNA-binding protein n=1 Tax=Aureimonas phyllosphaerae TaxID=1166078 RepID=A0A7W6BYU5_9HYPH|nr:AraC family transcriptional regulator [Aureimonas phyllosphaerae]MBB3937270.1 AraC-like DNA-binding protein [Aureimonas phyllosphaerae]MBB3961277.1 AraC-like DNA-binding protein [Aureimonas phyllosphaerae]SFF58009.1 transcriptional regulator, AraC family [Aureimonas phyllosphaerae]